jgi:hypothetical protein
MTTHVTDTSPASRALQEKTDYKYAASNQN